MSWPTADLQYAALLALLLPACAMDLWQHRIPNYLTYPALLAGLALGLLWGGLAGLGNHILGLLAAAIPLFVMFLGGSLGGGDVKLMAAVGAIAGFPSALNALFASILVGGLCAALILIWQGRLLGIAQYSWGHLRYRAGWSSLPPEPPTAHKDAFPFGVAIALGTLLSVPAPSFLTTG